MVDLPREVQQRDEDLSIELGRIIVTVKTKSTILRTQEVTRGPSPRENETAANSEAGRVV